MSVFAMQTPDLTPREIEIARLIARGRTYKNIADALGISQRTVRIHVANAAQKVGGPAKQPKIRLVLFVLNQSGT